MPYTNYIYSYLYVSVLRERELSRKIKHPDKIPKMVVFSLDDRQLCHIRSTAIKYILSIHVHEGVWQYIGKERKVVGNSKLTCL